MQEGTKARPRPIGGGRIFWKLNFNDQHKGLRTCVLVKIKSSERIY
jgi:hypothetical protein